MPSISRKHVGGREVIEVRVDQAPDLIGYIGRYRTRVGSTNRDLPPRDLARLVLDRSGQHWGALASPLDRDRVDAHALARFAKLAMPRLPGIDPADVDRTLQNLGLFRDGRLTNAGVLLFASRPQELFPQAGTRSARAGVLRRSRGVPGGLPQGSLYP